MNKSNRADIIINTSTGAATAAAVIPIPVADTVAITGVQISMVITLGTVYGKTITRHTAKGLIFVVIVAKAGEWIASIVKLIPGIGSFFGGFFQMLIAGTFTYSLGLAVNHLLSTDKELTKENLKESIKNQDKSEIKRKAERLKTQIRKTQNAEGNINFYAKPKKSKAEIRFYFNISNYENVTLRVTDVENGNVILERKVNTTHKSTGWKMNDLIDGDYIAYLECDDLLPIAIDIEKG